MKEYTETESLYTNIEKMSVEEILTNINNEDQKVANAVQKKLKEIENLIEAIEPNFTKKGRLFYVGAGTSGRLAIVDASECPPTFGVSENKVIGIMAGGDVAIRKAVEFAEDKEEQAWLDLLPYDLKPEDALIGIAASGKTPYVIGAIKKANEIGMVTGCVTCNSNSPLSHISQHPIEIIVGPEFITGSTRMKSGTAQKLVLNMISTTLMIKLGRIKNNKMVDMQLSNDKLYARGIRFIVEELNISPEQAKELLIKHGSVRNAINYFNNNA